MQLTVDSIMNVKHRKAATCTPPSPPFLPHLQSLLSAKTKEAHQPAHRIALNFPSSGHSTRDGVQRGAEPNVQPVGN